MDQLKDEKTQLKLYFVKQLEDLHEETINKTQLMSKNIQSLALGTMRAKSEN